jgi:hypothetical protein
LLARGSPSSRQEFVAAIVRPEIDEADENIGQIGLGLDAVQFTGLYQRSQDRPIFGAVIMTREESILAGKGLRAHRTLDDVGVELDAAIVEKAGKAVPVPEAVADDPSRIRAAREPRELMLEEDLERIDERARSCLASGTALIGTCAAHVLLDDIDLRDARDGFGGDWRIAALRS